DTHIPVHLTKNDKHRLFGSYVPMPLDRKQTSAPSLPVVSDSVQHLDANEILPYRSYISPEHKSGYPVKHDALGCGNVHHLRLPQGYEVVPPNHKDETTV